MPQRPSSPFFRALGVVAALLLPCGCGSSGGGDAGPPLTPTPPTPPPPTILSLTNFQPAAQVLGQPDLVSAKANQGGMPAANTLSSPSVAEPNGLFIVDSANHRVLGFQAMPTTNNANADFVLGQVDFLGNQGDQGGAPAADTLHLERSGLGTWLADFLSDPIEVVDVHLS